MGQCGNASKRQTPDAGGLNPSHPAGPLATVRKRFVATLRRDYGNAACGAQATQIVLLRGLGCGFRTRSEWQVVQYRRGGSG